MLLPSMKKFWITPEKIFASYCRVWRTYRFQFPKNHRCSFDGLLNEVAEDAELESVSGCFEMFLVCRSIGKQLRREVREYFRMAEIAGLRTQMAEVVTIIAGLFGIVGVVITILHLAGLGG